MSITALFTAVSGMNANGQGLSVLGDNVANMNTTAFKMSNVTFGDVVSQTMGTLQIGRGTLVADVSPQFTQGAFQNSSNVLDLAIDGDGFFVLKDGLTRYFTRAGQFGIDKQGYAVTPDGYKLQGYLFSTSGSSTSVLGDINVASLNSQPRATQDATINANLDSRSTVPSAFDETDPEATSNFTSTITVYDSLGNSHVLNLYYRLNTQSSSGNTWQWFAVVNDTDTASGNTEIQAAGTLEFNSNGALSSETAMASYSSPSGTTYTFNGFNFAGGASQNQDIAFDFGTSITEGGSGYNGTTQFGSPSTTAFLDQDGYTAGALKNISISERGIMTGIFTNGQTRNIAQIALAKFIAPSELTKLGRNLYGESYDSGQPIITQPGNTGTGSILSNTLELSNVDLASEFIKMIILQRGYQANSRIVSTTDELLAELVNLKR